MPEEKKSENRFWGIFVTLLIVFGIISLISRMFKVEWQYQLFGTLAAAAVATVVVVFVFRKLSR
ncbi:MAG: hypothetical protein QF408_09090 [Pirellulales bacterium]|jgi:UDP-N-acetylmuramyl pentapeptide phosphotransferase/UDP-N-acetylglucosamine-1-phosphate transferase|nr:hypothetical protein [Pirellulales bacterium]HJN67337.1 hypothetical protein [Pirellulales bacterium]